MDGFCLFFILHNFLLSTETKLLLLQGSFRFCYLDLELISFSIYFIVKQPRLLKSITQSAVLYTSVLREQLLDFSSYYFLVNFVSKHLNYLFNYLTYLKSLLIVSFKILALIVFSFQNSCCWLAFSPSVWDFGFVISHFLFIFAFKYYIKQNSKLCLIDFPHFVTNPKTFQQFYYFFFVIFTCLLQSKMNKFVFCVEAPSFQLFFKTDLQ